MIKAGKHAVSTWHKAAVATARVYLEDELPLLVVHAVSARTVGQHEVATLLVHLALKGRKLLHHLIPEEVTHNSAPSLVAVPDDPHRITTDTTSRVHSYLAAIRTCAAQRVNAPRRSRWPPPDRMDRSSCLTR